VKTLAIIQVTDLHKEKLMSSQKPLFFSPPDPHAFNAQVWRLVRQIPEGKVITYGQLARLIPAPMGVPPDSYQSLSPRWVGSAMSRCPPGLPWQRVLAAGGKISLPGQSGQRQRELLEAEGIEFDTRGRVNLELYGWQGPHSDD
jgi:methylated-DNA-protein-cysteine methyltransferase related protein